MSISNWDIKTVIIIFSVIFLVSYLYSLSDKNIKLVIFNKKINLNRFFYYLSLIIIVGVVGLQQSNSDYDTYSYLFKYEYGPNLHLFELEFIFKSLNYLIYQFFGEYKYLTLSVAFITYLYFFKSINYFSEKLELKKFQCMLLLMTIYMLVSFGMLRQICAASLCFYSLKFYDQKIFSKFLFFVFAAFGFHMSTILFLLIAIYAYRYKNKTINRLKHGIILFYYLTSTNSNLIINFIGKLSNRDYAFYSTFNGFGLGNIISRLPIIIVLFTFSKLLNNSNDTVKVFLNIVIFEIIGVFAYYFFPILGGRLIYFVKICYIILFPYILKKGTKEHKFSNLLIAIYCVYYVVSELLGSYWIAEPLMPIKFDI